METPPPIFPRRKRHTRLALAPLAALWFGASVIAIASAKTVLLAAPCPSFLCAVQFAVAAIGVRQVQPRVAALPSGAPEFNLVFGLAASYTLGFLLTNAAFDVAAPSFVETFKAAEPLSTVGLAICFLGERERTATYVSLIPIVIGVAIASSSKVTFSVLGMALALLSNVSFSARAVLTKALKKQFPESPASASDAQLFYMVSRVGVLMLLPFALIFDARTLWVVLVEQPADGGDGGALQTATAAVSGNASSDLLMGGGLGGPPSPIDGSSSNSTGSNRMSPLRLLCWLLVNGVAHATYNGVSFAVLSRVSVASHAVLNMVRRIVCIAAAAAFFGTQISYYNWGGVALAAAGVWGFAKSKERVRPALLPLTDPKKTRAV